MYDEIPGIRSVVSPGRQSEAAAPGEKRIDGPYAPRPVRTPRCAPDHPVRAAFRPLLRYPAVRRRQTKQSFVCQEDRSAASGRSRQIKRPNRTGYAVPYRILPLSSVFGEIEKQIATYPSLFRSRGKRGLGILPYPVLSYRSPKIKVFEIEKAIRM